MAFKFILALSFVVATSAGLIASHGQLGASAHYSINDHGLDHAEDYYDPHPNYSFHYSVHDGHTGDVKSQHETRNGDAVKGEYSLIDADGHQRTVTYSADHHSGFNAVVHREPIGHGIAVHSAPIALSDDALHSHDHSSSGYFSQSFHHL